MSSPTASRRRRGRSRTTRSLSASVTGGSSDEYSDYPPTQSQVQQEPDHEPQPQSTGSRRNRRRPGKKNGGGAGGSGGLPGVNEWPHGERELPNPHGVNDWPHSETKLDGLPGVANWPHGDPEINAMMAKSELPGVDDFPDTSQDDQDHVIKLRLDLNIDVAVELKARVHGDVTLALLM